MTIARPARVLPGALLLLIALPSLGQDRRAAGPPRSETAPLEAEPRQPPSRVPKVTTEEFAALRQARVQFTAGDLDAAQESAARCTTALCRKYQQELRAFADLHRQWESLDFAGLRALFDHAREITNDRTSSKLLDGPKRKAAEYYADAAQAALARHDPDTAKKQAAAALKLDPANPRAQAAAQAAQQR